MPASSSVAILGPPADHPNDAPVPLRPVPLLPGRPVREPVEVRTELVDGVPAPAQLLRGGRLWVVRRAEPLDGPAAGWRVAAAPGPGVPLALLELTEQKDIWEAIYLLKVRGAPAIGVAGGFGVYLAAKQIEADNYDDFYAQFKKAKEYLDSSRPTAVNLFWALARMRKAKDLRAEAEAIFAEDLAANHAMGAHGAKLIRDVPKDRSVSWNDVDADASLAAVRFRRELEAEFRAEHRITVS